MLSGDKEERVELVMLLVRNLLKENKDLRGMIQQMAGFLGEGEQNLSFDLGRVRLTTNRSRIMSAPPGSIGGTARRAVESRRYRYRL